MMHWIFLFSLLQLFCVLDTHPEEGRRCLMLLKVSSCGCLRRCYLTWMFLRFLFRVPSPSRTYSFAFERVPSLCLSPKIPEIDLQRFVSKVLSARTCRTKFEGVKVPAKVGRRPEKLMKTMSCPCNQAHSTSSSEGAVLRSSTSLNGRVVLGRLVSCDLVLRYL